MPHPPAIRRRLALAALVLLPPCTAAPAQVTFTDVTAAHFPDGLANGHYLWGDCDMDLYTANLAHNWGYLAFGHDISQLLENGGPPDFAFTDIRPSSGMRPFDTGVQNDWAETSPAWADYDNDGSLDIYVTHIYDSSAENYSDLYRGHADGTSMRTTEDHPELELYRDYSAAWCDFDQDGDLDLVTYGAPTPTGTASAHLFRNDGGDAGRWVHVRRSSGAEDVFAAIPMNRRLVVFEKGVTVRRGADPSVELPVLAPDVRLFPFRDAPSGSIVYYRIDDPRADREPMMVTRTGSGEVELHFR